MKVINLFAGPGAGKSTIAAMLFSLLKIRGYEAELVTEYAKYLTWANKETELKDQLYVFAKQDHRLEVLKDHAIDFVITDSPILQGLIYTPANYFPSFRPLVREVFDSYDNINFLINRVKSYSPVGRSQTEEEAARYCEKIKQTLGEEKIKYTVVDGNEQAAELIIKQLEKLDKIEKVK